MTANPLTGLRKSGTGDLLDSCPWNGVGIDRAATRLRGHADAVVVRQIQGRDGETGGGARLGLRVLAFGAGLRGAAPPFRGHVARPGQQQQGHEDSPADDVDGRAAAVLPPHPDGGDHQDPGQRGGDEDLPAERHELVIPDPGQRPAQPDEAEQQDQHLAQEPQQRPPAGVRPGPQRDRPRCPPAAEEQGGGQAGHRGHVDVLGEVEQRELERGVLGVEAAHQFALALGEVERQPVGLAHHGEQVDEERGEQQHRVPRRVVQDHPEQVELVAVRLGRHDRRGGQGAGVQEHRDEGQPHRDLVADHLRRRAQPAEQRVRRGRGPARQHDPVDAHRADREHEQHRDREVGELQRGVVVEDRHLGAERDDREADERGDQRDRRGHPEQQLSTCRGTMSSLSGSLMPSISDWSRPKGPARFGPGRCCIRPMIRRSAQIANSVVSIRNAKITTTLSRIIHHGWPRKLYTVTGRLPAGVPAGWPRCRARRRPC